MRRRIIYIYLLAHSVRASVGFTTFTLKTHNTVVVVGVVGVEILSRVLCNLNKYCLLHVDVFTCLMGFVCARVVFVGESNECVSTVSTPERFIFTHCIQSFFLPLQSSNPAKRNCILPRSNSLNVASIEINEFRTASVVSSRPYQMHPNAHPTMDPTNTCGIV